MNVFASPDVPGQLPGSFLRDDDTPFEERIARRAFELWQAEGCPDGRETNFWLEAERQLLDGAKKDAYVPRRGDKPERRDV